MPLVPCLYLLWFSYNQMENPKKHICPACKSLCPTTLFTLSKTLYSLNWRTQMAIEVMESPFESFNWAIQYSFHCRNDLNFFPCPTDFHWQEGISNFESKFQSSKWILEVASTALNIGDLSYNFKTRCSCFTTVSHILKSTFYFLFLIISIFLPSAWKAKVYFVFIFLGHFTFLVWETFDHWSLMYFAQHFQNL